MHPLEGKGKGLVSGIKPSLQVSFKEGWQWDGAKKVLVSTDGEETSLKGVLPTHAKIIPLIPSLAAADQKTFSKEERYLARNFQVILPRGKDPAEYVDALRQVSAVEEVRLPPLIALP
jgi:hypothetical protein